MLLERMQAAGVAPNVVSYSAAMNACGKAGQWEKALALLEEMPANGATPDLYCHSIAINACGKAGDVERVMKLFTQMQERGLQPDEVGLGDGGRPERILDGVGRRGPWQAGRQDHPDAKPPVAQATDEGGQRVATCILYLKTALKMF